MDYLSLLKSGIEDWNEWRSHHPHENCDLSGQDLRESYLYGGNFSNVNFRGANLQRACMIGANLQGADLRESNLSGAYLGESNLSGADLRNADLKGANLNRADLRQAQIEGLQLAAANTYKTLMSQPLPATPPTPAVDFSSPVSFSSSVSSGENLAAIGTISVDRAVVHKADDDGAAIANSNHNQHRSQHRSQRSLNWPVIGWMSAAVASVTLLVGISLISLSFRGSLFTNSFTRDNFSGNDTVQKEFLELD